MHAEQCHCKQLSKTCVQYIRVMFDVVKATEAWGALDEALKAEVQRIR